MFNIILHIGLNVCFFIMLFCNLINFRKLKNRSDKKTIRVIVLILMIVSAICYTVYAVCQVKAYLASGVLSDNRSELSLSSSIMIIANALMIENKRETTNK